MVKNGYFCKTHKLVVYTNIHGFCILNALVASLYPGTLMHHVGVNEPKFFACCVILHTFLLLDFFFQNEHFRKTLSGIPSVSNSFDQDQV